MNDSTGTLLWDGRHVLTAAHVVEKVVAGCFAGAGTAEITFPSPRGDVKYTVTSDKVTMHPNYNGDVFHGSDLAIVELPELAPGESNRYGIFRGDNEKSRWFYTVGYGFTSHL